MKQCIPNYMQNGYMAKRDYIPQVYEPLVLSYFAGIVDGEGCFTIYKTMPATYNRLQNAQYRASLTISNTKIELMHWLDEKFANLNHKHKHHRRFSRKEHKVYDRMIYEWTLQGFRLMDVCKQVLPYLVLKQEQCQLVIKLRETYGENHFGNTKCSDPKLLDQREEIRLANRVLNAKTVYRIIHTN
jgi:hypothetical protein